MKHVIAQAGIVACAGDGVTPFADLHFPYWAAKACDGHGDRMRIRLMCSTLAAQAEFTGLQAAAVSLMSSQPPSCSLFDLSRWGLLDAANAMCNSTVTASDVVATDDAPASDVVATADAHRSRSRSPQARRRRRS